jgi:hypothetical protein
MTCELCKGALWLCERHPMLPFVHDGCGGAGIPCRCNPDACVDWAEVHCEVNHEVGGTMTRC